VQEQLRELEVVAVESGAFDTRDELLQCDFVKEDVHVVGRTSNEG
jgi:hypothetical protein